MVENESNTCSMRKIILTSLKPFPEACFHNQPEEHVLHSANSFLKSLCPKKIGIEEKSVMITKVVIIKEQAIIIVKVNLRKNMPAVCKIIKD